MIILTQITQTIASKIFIDTQKLVLVKITTQTRISFSSLIGKATHIMY